tara:strand:+ start:191 stop:2707 length:2517 start_codon:yes stop_codon:yes gene_type:complete
MAELTPYDKEGEALRAIAQQLINPIIGQEQYGGDVQKALTGIRKKIRLDKATIREVAFVSLQEKGISISKEFADRKTGTYKDDFALFKNNFPEIKNRMAPIAGSLTGGDSPSAAEFRSGMNRFIKTHVNMSPEQLKAGKVPIGFTGLDTLYNKFNKAVSENKEGFFITSKGERSKRKAADRIFLGYLTASLSKVVNEGKERGPDGNVILVRTDDLTAGYRGQGRTGKGFDKGLTVKSFVNMIQKTISEIDKLTDVSDSDKANAKIYTLLNSYMPSRPKALKDTMTSKPVKGSGFENRPYFEMSNKKGYLMFPEGYGGTTKSYVSTELPNNITNIFLTLQDKKQGAGAAVPIIFDKDFTDGKLNKILSKTLGKVTAKPEYTTVLGKEAPAKSMATFRKLTAGAMVRSLNLPDLSGRALREFILAHGVDAKGEAYLKQVHGQTHGTIFNAFQHVLASESGLDDLTKLNSHLGFDPVTVSSDALSVKVDPSKTRVDMPSDKLSTVKEVELIPGVTTRVDADANLTPEQVDEAVSRDMSRVTAQRQTKIPLLQYLNSILPTDPSGEPIFIDEESKLKFLDYFDNNEQLNTFLSENVTDTDGSSTFKNKGKFPDNFNVIDAHNLFKKAESIRSRTVPVLDLTPEGIAKNGNILDQLKSIRTFTVPKSTIIGGPIGLGIELAMDPTSVAKADLPLPEDSTATQFAGQNIDRDLFQQEIENLSQTDEDLYLTQLENVASQRPLTKRESYDDFTPDEIGLLEGIQARYPKPPQQQRREELRIDPFTSEGELKPKAFRGYKTNEHEYTELDPSSLGDERRESIKAIEAADLKSRELDDQMSTLMGEI